MASRHEIAERIAQSIGQLYDTREARQIATLVVTTLGGITPTQMIVDPTAKISIDNIDRIINELQSGRPVQYVLGHSEFYGLDFEVAEGVLIPRPETEELVDWIVRDEPQATSILDIGTGSGCIAIALASAIPTAQVCAIDISEPALDIARRNNTRCGTHVEFVQADALGDIKATLHGTFDVIVSNPPYVPQSDIATIAQHVKAFEPHEALFVEDDNPLKFYIAIARQAHSLLTPSGSIYFEIYSAYAEQLCRQLEREGYTTTLRTDIFSKPRMICCRPNRK